MSKVKITGHASGSGTLTLTGPNTNSDRTITLPDSTGTLLTEVADNAVTLAKMASGTDGNIISYDASGNPVAIATGTDGQVLTSTGAGSPPAFESGGKLLQFVYTQSVSASAISTTATSYQASGIQLSITPIQSGSDIVVEFTSSHVDVRGGNSTRLIANMYVGGSSWTGAGTGSLAVIGHDTNSSETHATLAFSQRTTGTAGTAIAFEPYFYSNTGAATTLVSGSCSYIMKAWEIGA